MSFTDPDYSQYINFSPWMDQADPDPQQDPQYSAMLQMLMGGGGGQSLYGSPTYETQGKPGGAPLPQDIDTYNKVNTGYYHDMQNLFDPSLALMGAAYGQNTWDPGQFVDQTPELPQPQKYTPIYDSLRGGGGSYKAVADMIDMNASQPQINAAIRKKRDEGVITEDEANDLIDASKGALKEQSDYVRSLNDYQSKVATQKPQQTAMQKFAEQSGLPDPLATYTPDDIDLEQDDVTKRNLSDADEYERRAKYLESKAGTFEKEHYDKLYGPTIFGQQVGPQKAMQDMGNSQNAAKPVSNPSASNLDAANWPGALGHAAGSMFDGLIGKHDNVNASLNLAGTPQGMDALRQQMQAHAGGSDPVNGDYADEKWQATQKARGLTVDRRPNEAKKARTQAAAMKQLAQWNRDDAERSQAARKQAEANRKTQRGETPFADAVKQRQALYAYIRGGGTV